MSPSPIPQAQASFENACGEILQGDLKAALNILEPLSSDALPEQERTTRKAILDRFRLGRSGTPDIQAPFTREIAAIYMHYWTRCLLKVASHEEGESDLLNQLRTCLDQYGKAGSQFRSLDDLTEALGPMLRADGFFSLRGRTSPFYELMLWRKEEAKSYQVELPESTQAVRVVFMSDFAIQGWLGFATCGYYHSGGWAEKAALFCLEESYDLQSENFRVSYLAHEGQHFADYGKFPHLQQPELEYRAKLVELVQATETLPTLLDRFSRQGGQDRHSPHAYANRQVALNLSKMLFGDDSALQNPKRWPTKGGAEIHAAALACLKENTRLLESLGADRVAQLP